RGSLPSEEFVPRRSPHAAPVRLTAPRRAADASSSRSQEALLVERLLFAPQVIDGPRQPARQAAQRPLLADAPFLPRQVGLGLGQLADQKACGLAEGPLQVGVADLAVGARLPLAGALADTADETRVGEDRKSTRLNSSH